MKWFVIALVVACGGQAAAPESEAPEESAQSERTTNGPEWSALLDCDYGASHGWGHVYQCRVRETRDGSPTSEELSLNAAIGEDWLPDNEQTPLRGMLMRFRRSDRRYGPPSGYRDPQTRIYWVLVSATQENAGN